MVVSSGLFGAAFLLEKCIIEVLMPKSTSKKSEFIHPEQSDDEVFLGNLTHAKFNALKYSSKRQGLLACDENGDPVDGDMFPVFAEKSEVK